MAKVSEAVVLLLDAAALQPLSQCSALLPVGQQLLIEYTLGWLERNGLSEVHLVTMSQWSAELSAYLRSAGWSDGSRRGMAVHVLAAPGCLSEGEALRFVEQKDVVKGDFVLVSGSLVGNVDLRPAMQAHMARRSADRQALMTLLLHPTSPAAAGGNEDGRCLAVVDCKSQQLLRLEHGGKAGHGASFGTHLLGERDAIAVRSDLRLSHLFVCSPDVLALLSDNFDYQSIAGDLVPGVLSEQELGSTLHICELDRGYLERVSNVASYTSVVEDVVSRWAYPWVPDNSGDQIDSCRFNRGRYVDASATVASGSYVSKGSLVGRGSTVGAGACLERSIVGTDCHVGRGATLQAACLHSRVRVEDSCKLSHSVLAEQVVVRSHAKIETGGVLGKMTVIDSAHCVPATARISLMQQRNQDVAGSEDEEDWEESETIGIAAAEAAAAALATGGIPEASLGFDEAAVGQFGAGFTWTAREDGVQGLLPFVVQPHDRAECDSEAGDFTKDAPAVEDANPEEQLQGADQFKREVAETFLRCIKEHISHENAIIELNGLKIAEDRTFADCARYIFTTILSLCLPPSPTVKSEYRELFPCDVNLDCTSKQGRLDLLRRINMQLKSWKELLHRFLKSNDDQVELLLTFEEFCAEEGDFTTEERGSVFADLFPQVVKLCYDHDLLSEDAILDWAQEKENADEEDRHFVSMCTDFLSWLVSAEEESDSD